MHKQQHIFSTDVFLEPTLLYSHGLHMPLMGCPDSRMPCGAKQIMCKLRQQVIGKVVACTMTCSLTPSRTVFGFQYLPAAMQYVKQQLGTLCVC